MEPVSAELLMALATGGAGAAGAHAWRSLAALVRRGRGQTGPGDDAPAGGLEPALAEPELVVLQAEPADERRARDLVVALAARARADVDFAAALDQWHAQARRAVPATGAGDVTATVSGGSQGTVVTTRDVSGGLHVGTPAPPTAAPPEQPGTNGG
ncbi:hypothetical protein ACFYVL_42625 [Streptomyces sp. NPDC004111]|uniref:hypothetical protein n=1 Tax=Streptomyces sp. NPDC004111 TaxID=3364690 RepID=UPI0036BF9065